MSAARLAHLESASPAAKVRWWPSRSLIQIPRKTRAQNKSSLAGAPTSGNSFIRKFACLWKKHNCVGTWSIGGDCRNYIRYKKQLASRRKHMWLVDRMKHRPKGARVMRHACPNSECATCAVTHAVDKFALDFVGYGFTKDHKPCCRTKQVWRRNKAEHERWV